jgi:DNA-binding transcriptional regulator YdaS (Cro superfamily)
MRSVNTRNTKSLSPKQNEAIREALQKIIAANEGNMSAVARLLGVSRPYVYELVEGTRGAGITIAEAIARNAGVSVLELLGIAEQDDPDGEGTAWARLPGWDLASDAVIAEHQYLEPYVRRVGRLRGSRPPVVSADFVLRQALSFYESTPLADRARIARDATERAIEKHVKDADRREKKAREKPANDLALPVKPK